MVAIRVAVTRGDVVEAAHTVHATVVRDGRLVEHAGNPDLVACWRSCAKPVQALPLVRLEPGLPEEELAVACASHEARPEQLRAVRALLARSGSTEADLACGSEGGSRLRHNCSGKHAGMLLACRLGGRPAEGYHLAGHPLQREVHTLVAELAGVRPSELGAAVDGCGVPTFALPLAAMAAAFGRLGDGSAAGADRVLDAMRRHPRLVGGPESVDTRLMEAVPGAVAKRGAEGLLCGVLADGTAFALKCEDGAQRPLAVAAGALLGVDALREEHLTNSRGEPVGSIRAIG
jgi:L-asparaginase II